MSGRLDGQRAPVGVQDRWHAEADGELAFVLVPESGVGRMGTAVVRMTIAPVPLVIPASPRGGRLSAGAVGGRMSGDAVSYPDAMWSVSIVVGVAVTVAVMAVAVRGGRRRRMEPSRNAAARAIRDLSRDSRRQRGQQARGGGSHFGRTPIKKYGDERHGESEVGGQGGSGSGGGGD